MKKTIFILLLIPIISIAQNRQGGSGGGRLQKIHSAKIGMITERLNLTPEQAPQFWAVYNEYENKKIELKKSIRRTMEDAVSLAATDDKILSAQKQVISLRRKELDLEEEYMNKILRTITPRQFSELKRTEANFNKMLLEKLNEKADN
ncbi:Spy/CpxP family protein refolding chaperone [Emticicia sp. W12TSBA100-4]|uniref:Spy/CpxP family protein refolding chaperone n=1 Tax=Emticicia sp. W12TSBA100-4 TaxID=3160965 RepID=UPI0033067483